MKYFILSGTIATFTCSAALRKCPLKFPFLHPEQSFVIKHQSLSPQELSEKGAFANGTELMSGRWNGRNSRIELNVVILVY